MPQLEAKGAESGNKTLNRNEVKSYTRVQHVRTCQIGHTLRVHLKLVTLQVFTDERQQRVEDPHCPRHRRGRRVSVTCTTTHTHHK